SRFSPPHGHPPLLISFPYTPLFGSRRRQIAQIGAMKFEWQFKASRRGQIEDVQLRRSRAQRSTTPAADEARPAGDQDPFSSPEIDRKSTRLNSSHVASSYAVFCLKK